MEGLTATTKAENEGASADEQDQLEDEGRKGHDELDPVEDVAG